MGEGTPTGHSNQQRYQPHGSRGLAGPSDQRQAACHPRPASLAGCKSAGLLNCWSLRHCSRMDSHPSPTKSQPPATLKPGPKPPPSCVTVISLVQATMEPALAARTYSWVGVLHACIYDSDLDSLPEESCCVHLVNAGRDKCRVLCSRCIVTRKDHLFHLSLGQPDLHIGPHLANLWQGRQSSRI